MTIEEAKEIIQEFENFDFQLFTGSNLQDYLNDCKLKFNKLIFNRNIFILFDQKNYFSNKFVYRVRAADKVDDIYSLNKYSHPPIEITENFRANLKKHPVFYGSDHPITALKEVIQQKDKIEINRRYFITAWRVDSSDSLIIPFLDFQNNTGKKFEEYLIATYKSTGVKLSEHEFEATNYLSKYISSLFLKDGMYSKSSFLGHFFLYEYYKEKYSWLIYESQQTKYSALNFAFHPKFVKEKMKLDHIYDLNVEILNDKGSSVEFDFVINEPFAYVEGDEIIWTSIDVNRESFRKVHFFDFKHEFTFDKERH